MARVHLGGKHSSMYRCVTFAIYGLLEKELPVSVPGEKAAAYAASRKEPATLIEEAIAPSTEIPAWTEKNDVQREMRQAIKRRLRGALVDEDALDQKG